MEMVVIPVGDQKSRKHKEYGHPDMELAEKALHNVGKSIIKNVEVMGYEHQVRSKGAYTCQRRNIVLYSFLCQSCSELMCSKILVYTFKCKINAVTAVFKRFFGFTEIVRYEMA